MKRTIVLVTMLIAGGLLARSNPGEAAFDTYFRQHLEVTLRDNTGEINLRRMLTEIQTRAAGSITARRIDRTNAVILSIYTVDIGTGSGDVDEWTFLGIADQFFEIGKPESLK